MATPSFMPPLPPQPPPPPLAIPSFTPLPPARDDSCTVAGLDCHPFAMMMVFVSVASCLVLICSYCTYSKRPSDSKNQPWYQMFNSNPVLVAGSFLNLRSVMSPAPNKGKMRRWRSSWMDGADTVAELQATPRDDGEDEQPEEASPAAAAAGAGALTPTRSHSTMAVGDGFSTPPSSHSGRVQCVALGDASHPSPPPREPPRSATPARPMRSMASLTPQLRITDEQQQVPQAVPQAEEEQDRSVAHRSPEPPVPFPRLNSKPTVAAKEAPRLEVCANAPAPAPAPAPALEPAEPPSLPSLWHMDSVEQPKRRCGRDEGARSTERKLDLPGDRRGDLSTQKSSNVASPAGSRGATSISSTRPTACAQPTPLAIAHRPGASKPQPAAREAADASDDLGTIILGAAKRTLTTTIASFKEEGGLLDAEALSWTRSMPWPDFSRPSKPSDHGYWKWTPLAKAKQQAAEAGAVKAEDDLSWAGGGAAPPLSEPTGLDSSWRVEQVTPRQAGPRLNVAPPVVSHQLTLDEPTFMDDAVSVLIAASSSPAVQTPRSSTTGMKVLSSSGEDASQRITVAV